MRTARRRWLVRPHARRRRRCARHASRSGHANRCARRIMPGKAQVSVARYFSAFAAATPVFGRGQVSTYILAGLGDTSEEILAVCERLVAIGVYPFVVPFVPISGTPLESHPAPTAAFMHAILEAAGAHAGRQRPRIARRQSGLRQMRGLFGAFDLRAPSSRPGGSRMIFEPFAPFAPSEFQIKFAVDAWEKKAAAALRRKVFCEEQGIFRRRRPRCDRRNRDPLVAVSFVGVAADEVVGTVRIHQAEPGVWWGSRLAVAPDYRRIGALGAGLIRLAVSSAHARGCTRFLAHVQSQNAPDVRQIALAHARATRPARPAASSDGGRSRLLSAIRQRRRRASSLCERPRDAASDESIDVKRLPRMLRTSRGLAPRPISARSRAGSALSGSRSSPVGDDCAAIAGRRRLSVVRDRRVHE